MPIMIPLFPWACWRQPKRVQSYERSEGVRALQGCNLQAKIKEQGEHVHAKTLPWDLAVSYVFFLMDPEVKEVYVRGPNGGRYYDSLRAP